jgi:hypothetical protein
VDVPVGDTYTQAVSVKNVSESVLQITRITASNADFEVTGIMLPVVVAPGTSESFTISYRAKSEGRKEGEIGIVTSTGDTALVLKVRAVGTSGQRELTASEAGVDFEDVAVGSSTKKEVVLTNSGNRELRISRMSVSGADFTLSGAGAVNLSPGQNIALDVNFAPKGVGRKAGTLLVSSAEGGSLLEIPLAATGSRIVAERDKTELGGKSCKRSRLCRLPGDGGQRAVHAGYFLGCSVVGVHGYRAGRGPHLLLCGGGTGC